MNTQELVAALAEKTGATKKAAAEQIKALTEIVTEQVKQGGQVSVYGFGTFKAKSMKARTARNPKTGESIEVPARTALQFASVPALRKL